MIARLTDVRQVWGMRTFLLAYQGWASPWPIGCGYSAVANPVDVTGTIPSELSDSGMSPSRPSLDKDVLKFPEQFVDSIIVSPCHFGAV